MLFELAHLGTKPGDVRKTSSCSDVRSTRSRCRRNASPVLHCINSSPVLVVVKAPCSMIWKCLDVQGGTGAGYG